MNELNEFHTLFDHSPKKTRLLAPASPLWPSTVELEVGGCGFQEFPADSERPQMSRRLDRGGEQKEEVDVPAKAIQAPQAQERPFTLDLFTTLLFPDLDRRAQDVSSHKIDILWDAA
jgi:hypothetical protein